MVDQPHEPTPGHPIPAAVACVDAALAGVADAQRGR